MRGSWDGGYQPETAWVGVGFVLEGQHCIPTVSGSNWKDIATGVQHDMNELELFGCSRIDVFWSIVHLFDHWVFCSQLSVHD